METGLSWHLIGCGAALGASLAWAVGSILFRRIGDEASPLGMNLGKGLLGLALLGLALLVVGIDPISGRDLAILAASGVIGIALGDSFFFMALVRMDPRLTLLLGTVGQVATVLMAVVLLGERPGWRTWAGIPLVLGGVTWVMAEQFLADDDKRRKLRFQGLIWGLLASLCISGSFILAKLGLEEVSALQGTFLRFAFGMAGLALYGLLRGELGEWLRPFKSPQLLRRIVLAVLVVTFGGFWLTMAGYKYTDASLATILLSTEPIFILPLAWFFLKERVSWQAVCGAVVAVAGVVMILSGVGG